MNLRDVMAVAAALILSAAAQAETPIADLAKPPAGAEHFLILSTGGQHGESWIWRDAQGLHGRESMNLRGQVFELDGVVRLDGQGLIQSVEVRGVTPQGDATETFGIDQGQAHWISPVDKGSAKVGPPATYTTQGGPVLMTAVLVEAAVARAGQALALYPTGSITAEKLVSVAIGTGGSAKTVTAYALTGLSNTPIPVWVDARGKFFALTFGLAWVPEGYEAERAKLEQAQNEALAKRMPAMAKALVKTPTGPVIFKDVKIFDAEARVFRAHQSVLVDGAKITKVGAADQVQTPKGATVIAGKGMTLVPGLWDCHMHVSDDYTGVQELSLGVTSIRDPGNDDTHTLDRRARAAAGELLFPHVYASSLIDGKGPLTAQVANVATSEAEAIDLVRAAKAKGMVGVKFYGTFNPAWLKPAIAEAHELGLHVHGHVPAGIRPMDAIKAGYDEITHINWIIMQAMPQSVIDVSNGIARFEGPGRYAKDVKLDAEPMASLIKTMAAKKIISDTTMVAFEGLYVPENGDLSPAFAPFVGTLPPAAERGFKTGGFAVPKDLTRADYRASWKVMVDLLRRMNAAGVPIVAGTDGSGIEIVRELEIYVEAGMSPADALAAATLIPARLVERDQTTGSIKAGKVADLVLVEGDPDKRIGDLRQTRVVMLAGQVMDADQLRAAAGFSGRPK